MEEEKVYPFEFSVVMAVYNVEPFLREAVDSIIGQNFGFEKIQLILVDDGSLDNSGAICDEYGEKYPENIVVVHKANGGVSEARNTGLQYVTGRFVNFLDSDDKFTANTFSKVHKFFVRYENTVDVVAVPRFFFEGKTGAHNLNYRFQKGTRVIDLRKDFTAIQNTTSTAFFTERVAKSIKYNSNLKYCEDTLYVCHALLPKMKIGVVSGCKHYTRKRISGALSATQVMEQDKRFFLDPMNYLTKALLSYCNESLGYVPKFIQFTLLYELQWKLILPSYPASTMSQEEIKAYTQDLHEILTCIDDEIILAQKNMNMEYKISCLRRKYGSEPYRYLRDEDILMHYQNLDISYLSNHKCQIDILKIERGHLLIEGCILTPILNSNISVMARVNGELFACDYVERINKKQSLGEEIRVIYGFSVAIPLCAGNKYNIAIVCDVQNYPVIMQKITFGKFAPLTSNLKNSYYWKDGWSIQVRKNRLLVNESSKREKVRTEIALCRELWELNKEGARKAVFARTGYNFLRMFKRKQLWLISDRINKADDNGQVFFEYMSKLHEKNISCYFVLSPTATDYDMIKKFGKVITPDSWKFKLAYLLCDKIISSHADDSMLFPFHSYSYYYSDLMQNHQFVFLQHGIIKDDLSEWLNKYNRNVDLFVTSAAPEYQSIVNGAYNYTSNEVKLLGLPRYDKLNNCATRRITIMPSWRGYLVSGMDHKTGLRELKQGFEQSGYYHMYQELLNNQYLIEEAKKLGYTIQYMVHPNMVKALNRFSFHDDVTILSLDTSYRKIFSESSLIITDYSSVAFDFAYLRKPVLYYQADAEEFFSGAHTYEKGYFDYERDGFGEVCYDADGLVEKIVAYMRDECQLKVKYKDRIDNFFEYNDQNNCQRVYEEILKL